MKYTLLIGDSWGCGEWNAENSKITHKGFSTYTNKSVINLSIAGCSNYDILERLNNFLRSNALYIENIIIVQTEFTRGINNPKYKTQFNNIIKSSNSLTEFAMNMLYSFYNAVSNIACKFNKNILLVGGVSDVAIFDNAEHKNILVACQSWSNLLINNNPNITQEKSIYAFYSKNVNLLLKHFNKEDILHHITKVEYRLDQWKESNEYFSPNTGHPNRFGHRALVEYLIKENFL